MDDVERYRLAAAEAMIARYEHGISWDTTCENCANLLDRCYAESVRAETAEDALDEHRAHYVDPAEHARVVEGRGMLLARVRVAVDLTVQNVRAEIGDDAADLVESSLHAHLRAALTSEADQ